MDSYTAGKVRGGDSCPCIEANGVTQITVLGQQYIVYNDSDGVEHYYPSSYGTQTCQAHDSTLPPDCTDAEGKAKADAPAWCASRWCYVHREVCDQEDVKQSLYFGNEADLWYSYSKCGNTLRKTDEAYVAKSLLGF